jgi:hypothetical protein
MITAVRSASAHPILPRQLSWIEQRYIQRVKAIDMNSRKYLFCEVLIDFGISDK